jgi:hypothetical protein
MGHVSSNRAAQRSHGRWVLSGLSNSTCHLKTGTGKQKYKTNSAAGIPDSAFELHFIRCVSYNASYFIRRSFRNNIESLSADVFHLNPVDYSYAAVSGNYATTRSYAAYAIHETIYRLLAGKIYFPGRGGGAADTTLMAGTRLVEDEPFPANSTAQKPVGNLAKAIEELHQNITLGIFTMSPNIQYLVNDTVLATVSHDEIRWSYDTRTLLFSYLAFIIVTITSVGFGVVGILDNGGVGVLRNGFIRTLMTTRGQEFDHLVGGSIKGEDFMQDRIQSVEVKFRDKEGGFIIKV